MITVSKGDFTKNPENYLQKVEETGEEMIITHNQTPVLKIVAIRTTDDAFTDEEAEEKHHGDMMKQKKDDWEEF